MAITLICPRCQASFQLSDQLIGMTIRCGNCQEVFIVGAPRQPPIPPVAPVVNPVPIPPPNRPDPIDQGIQAQPGRRSPVVLEPASASSPAPRPLRRRPLPPRVIPIWVFLVGGAVTFVLLLGLGIVAVRLLLWKAIPSEDSKLFTLEQTVQPVWPPDPIPPIMLDPGHQDIALGVNSVVLTRTKIGKGIVELQRETWAFDPAYRVRWSHGSSRASSTNAPNPDNGRTDINVEVQLDARKKIQAVAVLYQRAGNADVEQQADGAWPPLARAKREKLKIEGKKAAARFSPGGFKVEGRYLFQVEFQDEDGRTVYTQAHEVSLKPPEANRNPQGGVGER
jgi:predicted Zn finger-like uncharacterized protein